MSASLKVRGSSFIERKHAVQSLITTTASDLQSTADATETSSVGAAIINDAHARLDSAQQSLRAADEENDLGNTASAYSALRESQSSVTEAGALLNAGIKFGKGHGRSGARSSQ
jgi:hypothetical protein